MRRYICCLFVLLAIHLPAAENSPPDRPFYMGFTRWPADMTTEGVQTAADFAGAHGDIVSIMMIGGLPWQEALDDKPFSADVDKVLNEKHPANKKIFLSISPLDNDRKGLAPYWGERDNMVLPAPWSTRAFNSPEVKRAFLNFTLRAIKAMKPDYLAIGIELNVLLSKNPGKWNELKELHRATYDAVKAQHPKLPVFFTTEVMHYRKLNAEAQQSNQEKEVADLMAKSDIFAMSFYPYMSLTPPLPLSANFFDFARSFKKPIAVSESGMTSQDVVLKTMNLTLKGSETQQKQFIDAVLSAARRDRYVFVINFATTDFEKLCARLPASIADLARIWSRTGLQTEDKQPKPALVVWDGYLKARYSRPQEK